MTYFFSLDDFTKKLPKACEEGDNVCQVKDKEDKINIVFATRVYCFFLVTLSDFLNKSVFCD